MASRLRQPKETTDDRDLIGSIDRFRRDSRGVGGKGDRVTADDVIEAVCAVANVSRQDLLSRSRLRRHSRPRQLAVLILHDKALISECQFSEMFSRHPMGLYRLAKEGAALVGHVDYVRAWRDSVLSHLAVRDWARSAA